MEDHTSPPDPRPIEVGEVVSLCVAGCPDECIEHGPDMTVIDVGASEATCCWFGSDGTYHERKFHLSRLSRELEVPKEGEVKKGRKKTEKRMVAGAAPASPTPPPGAFGGSARPAAEGGPETLSGAGKPAEAAITPEGAEAAKATKAAESKAPATPHPSTPHAKGK